MRFLGIGECNDLAAMYHGLAARGHEVRVFIEDSACKDVFGGMLALTDDWHAELAWVKEAGEQGVLLFESASRGVDQDALRRAGFNVIGGCVFGDRLESDREFGQQVLRDAGFCTARSYSFTDYSDAIDFVQEKGGRYVLKFNGASSPRTRNYIGAMDDGGDMLALLNMYQNNCADLPWPDFVLMAHVEGVEVGVGAYFNGESFLQPACMDFEHKRFFPGELGELTGEMGTIVSYRNSQRLFQATLAPLAGVLRVHGYCGYINLNLIVNERGLWPLEFTSRFGYPGFAICEALHEEPWEQIFMRLLRRDSLHLPTRDGFAAGVVLTVPPFPHRHGYEQLSKGVPICFQPDMTPADHAALYFAEVAKAGTQLVTSGATGYVGVATGVGTSVAAAREQALRVARKVVVPNLRYRCDIGERVSKCDLEYLRRLGWLGDEALKDEALEAPVGMLRRQ